MSTIRAALRQRFRSDSSKDRELASPSNDETATSPTSPDYNKQVGGGAVYSVGSGVELQAEDAFILRDFDDAASTGGPASYREDSSERSAGLSQCSLQDLDEQQVYENQLSLLQEQLVAAMIENQNLNAELHSYKNNQHISALQRELQQEQDRNKNLLDRIDTNNRLRPAVADSRRSSKSSQEATDAYLEEALEATEGLTVDAADDIPKAWSVWIQEWLIHHLYDFLSDFTEKEDQQEVEEVNIQGQLTVKKLKENIKRFKNDAKPLFLYGKGVKRIIHWKTPSLTLLIFIVYMYAVWNGWLLSVILLMCILQLAINYLRHRGWKLNLAVFSDAEEEDKEHDAFKDLGMSDKYNLVVEIAKEVQNTLGHLADNLEKVKNLFLWKQPDATLKLFVLLCVFLILASLLPGVLLFQLLALGIGVKAFIVAVIMHHFPRFRERHDTVGKIWKTLPTDYEVSNRYQMLVIDRNSMEFEESATSDVHYSRSRPVSRLRHRIRERRERHNDNFSNMVMSDELIDSDLTQTELGMSEAQRLFCELFQLTNNEIPLPGWHHGRRCTLINREKTLTSAFKHGRLYLTKSFLCFERSRSTPNKNLIISLAEISKVEKARPYAWMPGAGMSIEISMLNMDKPYMFGAILNRDECYDAVMSCGDKLGLPWGGMVIADDSVSVCTDKDSQAACNVSCHSDDVSQLDIPVLEEPVSTDIRL